MYSKKLIWLGMIVGSYAGGLFPALWGAGAFTMSSVLCSALGGFLGIWIGYRLGQY